MENNTAVANASVNNSNYLLTLIKIGKSLYNDYISETTRKRQGYLLISATVSILLAFTIIQPTSGGAAGLINFTLSTNPNVMKYLAAALCAYFVIVYSTSILQDINQHSLSVYTSIYDLKQVADSFNKLHWEKMNVELTSFDKAWDEVHAAEKESRTEAKEIIQNILAADTIRQKYQSKIVKLHQKFENIPGETKDWNAIFTRARLITEIDAIHDEMLSSLQNLLPGTQKEISDEIAHEDLRAKRKVEQEKIFYITDRIGKYRLYNNVRNAVEVWFPILIGLFAIWVNVQ